MSRPTVPSFVEFVKILCASGLIDREQLRPRLDRYRLRKTTAKDVNSLARHLLDEQLLTNWQLKRILQGNQGGFFLGKYKLLNLIGEGGMGTVYKAQHTIMRRMVALKVLPIDADKPRPDQQVLIERFRRECRATAALEHPNVVRVHDFDSNGKCYYLVMQFIQGRDLHHTVKQHGPMPVNEAVDCTRQAALGLGYAHRQGLIHRDVKPGNLLRDAAGTIKLLDLGIALVPAPGEESLTLAGNVMLGTADYLAPEQVLDSHGVDARADIYALGCTLHFLLTGDPPYPGGTKPQKMLRHLREQPPSLRERRDDVPAQLEEIYQRMMAKDRDERYASCEEVVAALDAWSRLDGSPAEFDSALGEANDLASSESAID